MAPSVQEVVPEVQAPTVNPEKLIAITKEEPKETVRVKRQIEVEGGKTDAKVYCLQTRNP